MAPKKAKKGGKWILVCVRCRAALDGKQMTSNDWRIDFADCARCGHRNFMPKRVN